VLFDDASGFLMVQMPIMKKIDMVSVLDGGMPAVLAVNVGVIFVGMGHWTFSFKSKKGPS
jgi:hypothetical protein